MRKHSRYRRKAKPLDQTGFEQLSVGTRDVGGIRREIGTLR